MRFSPGAAAIAFVALLEVLDLIGLPCGPLSALKRPEPWAALLVVLALRRRDLWHLPLVAWAAVAALRLSLCLHPDTFAAEAWAAQSFVHLPAWVLPAVVGPVASAVGIGLLALAEKGGTPSVAPGRNSYAVLAFVSAALALLVPLAAPRGVFDAAGPTLGRAFTLSEHHLQDPRTSLAPLAATWGVLAALRAPRLWPPAAAVLVALVLSGAEFAVAIPGAVAAAVFADAPRSRRGLSALGALALWTVYFREFNELAPAEAYGERSIFARALVALLFVLTCALPFTGARPLVRGSQAQPPATRAPPVSRREQALACVFFLSGAAGLFYEIVFSRALALTFGSTARASTVVLATYMGGLALGSYAGGWLAQRVRSAVRAYALCEAAIGAWCIFAPSLFHAARSLYVALAAGSAPGPAQTALQLALSAAVIFPATFAMGMTLPLLVRDLYRGAGMGRVAGLLYGANTLGAAMGALLAGYAVLPALGISKTLALAVALNWLAATAGAVLSRKGARARAAAANAPETAAVPPGDSRLSFISLVILTIGGAVSFALETASIHLLATVAGNSAMAFALMLFAFLLGLGIGAAWARRRIARGARVALEMGLAQLALAACVLAGVFVWSAIPGALGARGGWGPLETFAAREVARAIACLVAMIPPALCIGASFTLTMEALKGGVAALGRAAALNTVGNVAGALLGGFVLLPHLGSLRTLQLLAAIALGLGLLPLLVTAERLRLSAAAAVVCALFLLQPAQFDWTAIASGTNVYFQGTVWGTVIDHAESLDGGVTTVNQNGKQHTLLTNGKFQGNDSGEMAAQGGFAEVPLHHTKARDSALNIGFGTGATARTLHDAGYKRLDVVDLSDDILRLAERWFTKVNGDVLKRPNVRRIVADGRNFLLLSKDRYQLISLEISSIWFAGAASLYNREFYQLVEAHLTGDGVLQQWVQLHHITVKDVSSILRTVRDEFPQVWLYSVGGQGVIIACKAACPPDATPWLLLDPQGVDGFLARNPSPISDDDNLYLEYSTPRGNVLPASATEDLLASLTR